MRPLTITIPHKSLKEIKSGIRNFVATKRNPRKDKYFFSKSPDTAKINGVMFGIRKIIITDTEIKVYV